MPSRLSFGTTTVKSHFRRALTKELPPRGDSNCICRRYCLFGPGRYTQTSRSSRKPVNANPGKLGRRSQNDNFQGKSKLLILKGNMAARPPVIKFKGIRIPKGDAATYLGIKIDTGLTFLPHVMKQGTKARNLFCKIGRLL